VKGRSERQPEQRTLGAAAPRGGTARIANRRSESRAAPIALSGSASSTTLVSHGQVPGREPLNFARRSTAEPCERSAHDVSAIRLKDDRHAQLEQARHRVVRDTAVGRARLVRERVACRPSAMALYAKFTLTNVGATPQATRAA
jgi:hypothetical protein